MDKEDVQSRNQHFELTTAFNHLIPVIIFKTIQLRSADFFFYQDIFFLILKIIIKLCRLSVNSKLTNKDASQTCENIGGKLPTFESTEEVEVN